MVRPTILIVEDEHAVQQVLADLLADAGYHVALAASGAQARGLIRHLVPDLVLLDVRLPDVDGHALCRELRRELRLPAAILMLTADGDPRRALAAFESGADDYLRKPFQATELLAQIRSHLAARGR